MTEIILALSKFTYLLSATLTIGQLLNLAFFTKNSKGLIKSENRDLISRASTWAWLWFGSSIIFLVSTLASVLDVTFTQALDLTTLRSFVTQISLGKFLAIQALGALVIAMWIRKTQKVNYVTLNLVIALVALSAPIFQSHSASGGSHLVAIGTLVVHVLAITMWVGGLLAIVTDHKLDKSHALNRFSHLALWAAITVIISGAVNAYIRMNFAEAWQGGYAKLLIEKIILTVIILAVAAKVRKTFKSEDTKLITVEVSLLTLTLFVGTLLSQSNPPVRPGVINSIEALVGLKYPGLPTLKTWFFEYQPDALTLAVLIFAALLYFKGVRILHRRGDSWPVGRTISFSISFISRLIILSFITYFVF